MKTCRAAWACVVATALVLLLAGDLRAAWPERHERQWRTPPVFDEAYGQPGADRYPPFPLTTSYGPYGGAANNPRWGAPYSWSERGGSTDEAAPPDVSVRLSDSHPHVHQSVILTVTIVSRGNVKAFEAPILGLETVSTELLEGPHNRPIANGGGGFVTEYHYVLTPLVPGEIELPAIRVRGTLLPGDRSAGSSVYPRAEGESFVVESAGPHHLNVRPPEAGIHPWRPLYGLRFAARILNEGPYAPGAPVYVEIDTIAHGTTADRLPSPEVYFQEAALKYYHDGSHMDTRLADDGRSVLARRSDRFTVIPEAGSNLRLPAVEAPWWNVTKVKADRALLAARTLAVEGVDPPPAAMAKGIEKEGREAPSGQQERTISGYWVIPIMVAGVLLAFWAGGWARDREVLSRLWHTLLAAVPVVAAVIVAHAQRVARPLWRLLPVHRFRHLPQRLILAMPASIKLRYCLRQIDCEDDPTAWCQLFQLLVYRHLGMPVNAPLNEIVESMIASAAPPLNAGQLRGLLAELDSARYGARPLEFAAWKQAFRRALCPWGVRFRPRRVRHAEAGLPPLNPGPT